VARSDPAADVAWLVGVTVAAAWSPLPGDDVAITTPDAAAATVTTQKR
jgi:hypothetical protein